jgi:hypothetical protein
MTRHARQARIRVEDFLEIQKLVAMAEMELHAASERLGETLSGLLERPAKASPESLQELEAKLNLALNSWEEAWAHATDLEISPMDEVFEAFEILGLVDAVEILTLLVEWKSERRKSFHLAFQEISDSLKVETTDDVEALEAAISNLRAEKDMFEASRVKLAENIEHITEWLHAGSDDEADARSTTLSTPLVDLDEMTDSGITLRSFVLAGESLRALNDMSTHDLASEGSTADLVASGIGQGFVIV